MLSLQDMRSTFCMSVTGQPGVWEQLQLLQSDTMLLICHICASLYASPSAFTNVLFISMKFINMKSLIINVLFILNFSLVDEETEVQRD